MDRAAILEQVSAYYDQSLREHGETAQGVDWNSSDAQTLRYRQLLRVVPPSATGYTLLDYGCGYGALRDILVDDGVTCRYLGYDVSEDMITRARRRHGSDDYAFSTNLDELGTADYVVASGVFNVRLRIRVADWKDYVAESLEDLHRTSRRGFAFNLLTTYADPDRMTDNLYYADPSEYFDYCKRSFSPQVALLHDYGLFEFTILVRKSAE